MKGAGCDLSLNCTLLIDLTAVNMSICQQTLKGHIFDRCKFLVKMNLLNCGVKLVSALCSYCIDEAAESTMQTINGIQM